MPGGLFVCRQIHQKPLKIRLGTADKRSIQSISLILGTKSRGFLAFVMSSA
jgi:glutamate mutase epsilon subunit